MASHELMRRIQQIILTKVFQIRKLLKKPLWLHWVPLLFPIGYGSFQNLLSFEIPAFNLILQVKC